MKATDLTEQPFPDFVSVLHQNVMKKLKIKPYDYIILKIIITHPITDEGRILRIRSPVIPITHKNVEPSMREDFTEGDIGLDQTYRDSLFIKTGYKVDVYIPETRVKLIDRILYSMNFQKATVRVQTNAAYMERKIPVACLCDEMMNSIGAGFGDHIIIESVGAKKGVKISAIAAPLTSTMQKFHDSVIKSKPKSPEEDSGLEIPKEDIPEKYTEPGEWVEDLKKHSDTIHPIFMDAIGRKKLGIQSTLFPVKIKRSFRWEFFKKMSTLGSFNLLVLPVTIFAMASNPDNVIYWIIAGISIAWGIWGILTSSTYKTTNL